MKKIIILFFILSFAKIEAQVNSGLSSFSVKYGEPILLRIEATSETENDVVLPEIKDTLSYHLEVLDRKTDTIVKQNKFIFIDSITFSGFEKGRFKVPELKVSIGKEDYFTPEYLIDIDSVVIDTLKQNLYDIKPIIEEPYSLKDYLLEYWFYILIALIIIIIIVVLIILYVVERKKKKEIFIEKIDVATLNKISKLEKSNYLKKGLYKKYFSELDEILREYLTNRWNFPADKLLSRELIAYISKRHYLVDKQITNLETFFFTADMVKFAKSIPSNEESKLYTEQVKRFVEETKLEFYNTRKIDE